LYRRDLLIENRLTISESEIQYRVRLCTIVRH
jgi:hypothetical protein